ncbi:RNA-binding protein 44 [Geospiza fortis]|uniref:Receptor activity-modifying protein 1 n=1 Tax=Geospiza fortis TaxID=48883 RepID=A0A8N5I3I2_GEOFO|nr:RNA-binding protein 44 [Geospiza fortis]
MEVEKGSRRSCSTQTSCLGVDLGEDSQLEYLSAHEEYDEEKSNWSEFSEQEDVGEVKAVPLIGDKVPSQITAGEEDSGKSQRPTQSVAVEPDVPFLPPREEAQLCKHGEPSYFSSCEEPAVCTRGTSSTAEDAETQLPGPAILPGKNPVAGMEAADQSCAGNPRAGKSERGEALSSVPSGTVDAGSNPRAGFPTSRSSSAQVRLCSRAVSKAQPMGWLGQTSVDAASNTEWPEHPNKQTGKNSASSCCQNVLQRATEAELQLLAIHYEMCYQHCLKVYELALEENTCLGSPYFNSCEKKAELYSSLQLALDELDNNYSNMRKEINMGTPLNELPPLSVELRFPPLSSFYIPSKDNSQTDGDQPSDSASAERWEELLKDQALERGCVKNEEGSEYWFDAKEDLSVADISVMCKEMKKQQGKQDSIDSREVKIVVSGKERSSVPVGGPKPSVLEDPGENSLQKTSTCSSVKSSGIFVSPYALNLSSFTKLIRRLQEKYPGFSRGEIVGAVQEVRKMNKGVLSGLAISSIEEKASAILRTQHFIAATACQEADYSAMIHHYCLKDFQHSMEGIGQRLWCDWDETVG